MLLQLPPLAVTGSTDMRQFTDTDVQLGLFDEQVFPEPPRPPSRMVLGMTDVGWFWTSYFALILLFISIGIYYW